MAFTADMNLLASAATGICKEKDTVVRYEVHRELEDARKGKARPPITEEFLALDRARIAAFGYALEGPIQAGGITGVVRIVQKLYSQGGAKVDREELIDVIDERVAFRLLNEVRLPRADELSVSRTQLQAEVDALLPR